MKYDVAIIGGGAAGLFSAVYLKQNRPDIQIVVFEALDRACKKLITTGNGRCNITNRFATLKNYHGASADFIGSVFERFFVDDSVEMFKKIGIEIVFEDDGRAYPMSYQASSVVDAFRFFCEENNIEIKTNCAVKDIKQQDGYAIKTTDEMFFAKTVIVTGGLVAGGKSVGSTGDVLSIAQRLGIKCAPLSPAIVQLKTNTEITKQLKGIKIDCNASLIQGNSCKRTEFGEVLFTDYGLSGPPILQISRNALPGTKISLDLVPKMQKDTLVLLLKSRKELLCKRSLENYLTGFLNKRLGQVILKDCGFKLSQNVADLTEKDITVIADKIKHFEFSVTGNTGFNNAQVCCGGVKETELSRDLESKKYKGMFFAGEIIDVDGDCGGYNLQWAWSSGAVAGDGVLKCL